MVVFASLIGVLVLGGYDVSLSFSFGLNGLTQVLYCGQTFLTNGYELPCLLFSAQMFLEYHVICRTEER